jgi:O-antigen ligase/Flp pilus assembly protein TadD
MRSRLENCPGTVRAIVAVVGLYFAWYAVSAGLSISPRLSVQGSHIRMQGLYTTAAYAVLFGSIAFEVRSREQLDRIITTVLLVSLPVSIYGITQHFGGDPLSWKYPVTQRVPSTIGNPIFVAAFLVMAMPLALYRLRLAWKSASHGESSVDSGILIAGGLVSFAFQMTAWTTGPLVGSISAAITLATWVAIAVLLRKPLIPLVRLALYLVLISAQGMCIVFSGSRGPFLALIVGLLFFTIVGLLAAGHTKKARIALAAGTAAAAVLLVVNVSPKASDAFSQVPNLGRLASLLEVDRTSRVRLLIWEGTTETVLSDPGRFLIGYGPETMQIPFRRHYPADLAYVSSRRAVPDRAHNETLDAAVTTGAIGACLYLAVFLSTFYVGLRWIGMLRRERERTGFWIIILTTSALFVAVVRIMSGSWALTALGVGIGTVSGLFAYAIWTAFSRTAVGATLQRDARRDLLIVALLAAIVAHFFEIQFGIAIVPTRTMFWTCLGLLVAAGRIPVGLARDADRSLDAGAASGGIESGGRIANGEISSFAATTLVVGIVALTLAYDFQLAGLEYIVMRPGLAWMISFSLVFAGIFIIFETSHACGSRTSDRIGAVAGLAVLSIVPAVILVVARALAPVSYLSEGGLFEIFCLVLVGMVLLPGITIRSQDLVMRRRPRIAGALALVVGVLATWPAVHLNLNIIRADTVFKQAVSATERRDHLRAVGLLRRVIELAPEQDYYYMQLGAALVESAGAVAPADRVRILREAEVSLGTARSLSPLDADHAANLARLHRIWADNVGDDPTRRDEYDRSAAYYRKATMMSPRTAHLWNEYAAIELARTDTARALDLYAHSLGLDDGYDETYAQVGNVWVARGDWTRAAEYFQHALDRNPSSGRLRQFLEMATRNAVAESERQTGD